MNLLLPVDGSKCSLKAVRFVADSVNWFKEMPQIILIHVDDIGVAVESARRRLGNEAVDNYFRESAKDELQPAERILKEKGYSYRSIYAGGDVAAQICAHAKSCQIDMIVMGSHGKSAVAGLVLGSVTNKVLAMTSIPVIIIRDGAMK